MQASFVPNIGFLFFIVFTHLMLLSCAVFSVVVVKEVPFVFWDDPVESDFLQSLLLKNAGQTPRLLTWRFVVSIPNSCQQSLFYFDFSDACNYE